jgi:hypothetical protein
VYASGMLEEAIDTLTIEIRKLREAVERQNEVVASARDARARVDKAQVAVLPELVDERTAAGMLAVSVAPLAPSESRPTLPKSGQPCSIPSPGVAELASAPPTGRFHVGGLVSSQEWQRAGSRALQLSSGSVQWPERRDGDSEVRMDRLWP